MYTSDDFLIDGLDFFPFKNTHKTEWKQLLHSELYSLVAVATKYHVLMNSKCNQE